jgi:hypothetical protein
MTLMTNRLEKARRIVNFAQRRGVLEQALTYSDAEWQEMVRQAGEQPASAETVEVCRALVGERMSPPPVAHDPQAIAGFTE